MKTSNKEFWRGLLITITVLGIMLGGTIHLALKERRQNEEFARRNAERTENIKRSIKLSRQHNDSVANSTKRNVKKRYKLGTDEADDNDPYDNPDFDDIIPGEEYDEEFVDRSQGDLELYNHP